jgi:hypothetical protein
MLPRETLVGLTSPVLVLGAGSTKACNGPLTNEILIAVGQAISNIEREGYLSALDRFLEDVFHMQQRPSVLSLMLKFLWSDASRSKNLGPRTV